MRMLQPMGGDLSHEDLEAAYAYPVERTWLRLSFVSSLDGAIADASGHPVGLSSAADQRVFMLLRGLADVVLVGAGTATAEQYAPVRPHEVDQQMRARLGLAPLPPIAVVSNRLEVTESLLSGGGARTLVVTSAAAPPARVEALRERADVLVCGNERVDPRAVVEALGARGLRRIQAEGGPRLSRDLAAAGVLDEVCLTVSPLLVAGDSSRLLVGAALDPARRLVVGHVLASGDDLLVRYIREGA